MHTPLDLLRIAAVALEFLLLVALCAVLLGPPAAMVMIERKWQGKARRR